MNLQTLTLLLLSAVLLSTHCQEPYYTRASRSTSSFFITWTTFDDKAGRYTPYVEYGVDAHSLNQHAISDITKTYYNSSGFHHTVILPNITEGNYYYRVGNKGGDMSATVYQMRVSNKAKVLLYGDMGYLRSGHTVNSVKKRLQTEKDISMVYHVGDIGYADDFPSVMYDLVFHKWLAMVNEITSVVPYQVCPGNHDRGCKIPPLCHDYMKQFRPYNYIFYMPSYQQKGHNMFYSFDLGDIHFTSFSTETDYPDCPFDEQFGDQVAWFTQDLKNAAANRRNVPWIVVIGHRPIYSSHYDQSGSDGKPKGVAAALQKTFESIMHQYQVDLFMMGHIHSYERFHPVYNNTAKCDSNCTPETNTYHNPEYTVHIVNGGAGCEEGLSPTASFHKGNPNSAKIYNSDYGYGILETSQQEQQLVMNWKYFASSTDAVADEMTIFKSKPQ